MSIGLYHHSNKFYLNVRHVVSEVFIKLPADCPLLYSQSYNSAILTMLIRG